MFKTIALGIVGVVAYQVITAEPNSEAIQAAHLAECQAEYGAENIKGINRYSTDASCKFTDAYEELLEAKEAEEKAIAEAKKEEEKRIAQAKAEAYRNSPEGKTESFVSQAGSLCRQHVRASAKFPSKVDFDWGNKNKYWMNFSEGKSRVLIQQSGEMMNGLGMMIPFTAACKYDYDPATNKYSIAEILI